MKKITNFIILLISATCFLNCSKEKIKYTYYNDGKIYQRISLLNNKRNGLFESYYRDGKIKSRSMWKNNFQNGFYEQYSQNGKINKKGYFKNNLANGLWKEFNDKGFIVKKYIYKNDTIVKYSIFYEYGIPVEKQFLNDKGELMRVIGYNRDGEKNSDTIVPIFDDIEDSVYINKKYLTKIKFGYNLRGKVKIIIGEIDRIGNVVDTLNVLYPSTGNEFIYSTITNKIGVNKIQYKLIQNEKDSLSVDGLTGFHKYYVLAEK